MSKPAELLGRTFGSLTVLERQKNTLSGRACWFCKCACGETKVVLGRYLLSGETTSCGCKRRKMLVARNFRHGHASRLHRSPSYHVWYSMWQRCSNPKHKHYKYYGGRGIVVCEEWMRFDQFLEDMGERPSGLTLDRRDTNGNYEKDNCRWVEWGIQVSNRRKQTRGEENESR